jgi:hypothetical protein
MAAIGPSTTSASPLGMSALPGEAAPVTSWDQENAPPSRRACHRCAVTIAIPNDSNLVSFSRAAGFADSRGFRLFMADVCERAPRGKVLGRARINTSTDAAIGNAPRRATFGVPRSRRPSALVPAPCSGGEARKAIQWGFILVMCAAFSLGVL